MRLILSLFICFICLISYAQEMKKDSVQIKDYEVLKKYYKIDATLLIDDIKSELDERVFKLFSDLLNHINTQVIFSCIDDCFSSKITSSFNEFKKFHVEQLGK